MTDHKFMNITDDRLQAGVERDSNHPTQITIQRNINRINML